MWSVVRLRSKRSHPMKKTTTSQNDRHDRQRNLERQFGPYEPNNRLLKSLYWALRGCQYWLCFYDDEVEVDIEDLLSNPFNTQPPSLDQLQQMTGFDKNWLMFMYRNFKQKCSNGRMMGYQWRSIFRMLFPHAVDHQFADRLYQAISQLRGHPHITFEDLIICIWQLTEGGAIACQNNQDHEPDISVKAAFVFAMMSPDAKGRVDMATFQKYVHSIFTLYGNREETDNSSTLGLPTSFPYRRNTVASEPRPMSRNVKRLAVERFRALDTDRDGYITVLDIEREFKNNRSFTILSTRDLDETAAKSEETASGENNSPHEQTQ